MISKAGSAAKIKLNSYDDLFGATQVPAGTEQVQKIPLSELHEFQGHPFKVLDDEKMQETVESIKNYGVLMFKDMSRFGRDYLKVGFYTEVMFKDKDVRFIAVNNGIDSSKQNDNDFTPFLNIMNEYYARDTSKKIKSVFKAKGMSGKHLTGTVIYGYLWDEKREHWFVDEEAAAIVQRIFQWTMEGFGPYQISQLLKEQKAEIPSVHLARYGEGVNKNKTVKDIYGWGSSAIVNILKKREYLGHTVNFKTRKHFKDKKSHYVDESEWTIFENTHEAIIDQETFGNVQRIRQRYLKEHRPALYSSLLLTEKLYPHLLEIDEAARERMDILMPQLMKAAGVTEELKAADQIKWVGLANACKAQAEETILEELIFD